MNIKQGSRWTGSDHSKKFIVLSEVQLDDGVWIHYRDEKGDPQKSIVVSKTVSCQDLPHYQNEYRDCCSLACRPKWILVE